MADPPTHFFKFIRPGFKFNTSIPRGFLTSNKYHKATLRRAGDEWPVDVSHNGVFGDGWRKFVRENGVQDFNVIVFKRQRKMMFDFWVFDESTCERQYPNLYSEFDVVTDADPIHTHKGLKRIKNKKRKRNDYASEKEDNRRFVCKLKRHNIQSSRLNIPAEFVRSNGLLTKSLSTQVILMDETQRTWPATLRILNKSQLRLISLGEFIRKNHLKVGDECMFELIKRGQMPEFNVYRKKAVKNSIMKKETAVIKEKSVKNPIVKENAVKIETDLTLNDHPYFLSSLTPYNVKKSILQRLPNEFWRGNGLNIGEMILRDDKARSWKVQVNKIEGLKRSKKHKRDDYASENEDNPRFVCKLKCHHIQSSRLNVPAEFIRSNGLITKGLSTQVVLMDETQRTWLSTLKIYNNFQPWLIGLGEFIRKNHLKVGDACIFDLVKKGQVPAFNVYRKNSVENSILKESAVKKSVKNRIVRKESGMKKETDLTLTDHPYFLSSLTTYSIKRSVLRLPSKFWRGNGLNIGEMILRDDKGRSWKVGVNKKGESVLYIGTGFRAFCGANGFKEGAPFKFELVENDKDMPPVVNFSSAGDKRMAVAVYPSCIGDACLQSD